ncbi:MAG: 4Fe-4S binding protein [Thermacetogeniaceae bacterium]
MGEVDYKALKKGGFMRQVQPDLFSMRLRVVGGQLRAGQVKKIAEIAEKYGAGYIHLTSRQGVEIPFVKLNEIEEIKQELAKAGLAPGACGPRVRTVTACQGNRICPSGLIDTTALAEKIDERYFGQEQHHKFKVGITGCHNNCLKAEENDLGIKGALKPAWNEENCNFCGLCEAICPSKSIKVDQESNKLSFDESACTYCGRCVKSCPGDAWSGAGGYILLFGGTFGNRILVGKNVIPVVFEENQVFKLIDRTLDFFREYGKQGERFGYCLERVGMEKLQDALGEAWR